MPTLKLYGHPLSGHSYKVKLFFALTGVEHDYEIIDLRTPRSQRPATFRDCARFGEVPLLKVDGTPYVQSNAILLHLSQLLGRFDGGSKHTQRVEWLMWEQSRLGSSLPNLRFLQKFNTDTDPAVLAWLEGRLRGDLDVLNTHLQANGPFMLGEELSIADCSLAGYLYWLEDARLDIAQWPSIEAWLAHLSTLKGWQHPDKLLA